MAIRILAMLIWNPVMWVAKAMRASRFCASVTSAPARVRSEPRKTSFCMSSGRRLPMVWKCSGRPLALMTSQSGFQ